jgi:hypothetical protein
MPARKATAIVQLKVRMREDLRRRLEREANRRKDSINNEIVQRLEQSFLVPDVAEATANAVMERLTLRIGGKPVTFEVDYAKDPDRYLRVISERGVSSEREQQKAAIGELRRGLNPWGEVPPDYRRAYGEAVGRLSDERNRGEITHDAFMAGIRALKPLVADLGRNEITPRAFAAAARALIDDLKRKQTAGPRLTQPEKGETK